VNDASKRRAEVTRAEQQLRGTLSKVKGDLADLVAEAAAAQRARDAARAAALARAQTTAAAALRASRSRPATPSPSTIDDSDDAGDTAPNGSLRPSPNSTSSFSPAPAARSSAQAAVAAALSQVGKPYRWGGSGPDSFDCSGLTLWAWRAAGVSLPHFTGAQYGSTTHISLSQLQPGDLVYNRSMGHMGMYIGNGNMVHAPHTGDVVRIVPLRGDMALASRP
jgi:cell wall-associated NlpC family hydrolase